jgi:hypothetical protein
VAKKQEQLLLMQKQRDVLHEVQQGQLMRAAGCEQLGLSERWVRELVRQLSRQRPEAKLPGVGIQFLAYRC